ncbi:hypothetical protein RBSH_05879 [Rhodopirellula baltica SH28]|uniref:Uncharacterized protein n=2 Tax=Rhodopirellula baltica TaxID=265606 RepID=K5CXK9_RHOBT|nr:hypothetical protein RBSH_05879 [Rhodopirellula baltica SH28]ELP31295.1 hypothetical protein RBSWK_04760 [Rhodopirellula baltica SWK14]
MHLMRYGQQLSAASHGQLVLWCSAAPDFCLSKATALRSTNRFAYLTIHPDLQRFSPRTPTQLL